MVLALDCFVCQVFGDLLVDHREGRSYMVLGVLEDHLGVQVDLLVPFVACWEVLLLIRMVQAASLALLMAQMTAEM